MNKVTQVLNYIAAAAFALIILLALGTFFNWFYQQSFKVQREEYCDRITILTTSEGNRTITDPRPVFVCNF